MKTILMIWFLCLGSAFAGNAGTDPEDKVPVKAHSSKLRKTLQFSNINEQYYFNDEALLADIRRLRKKKDSLALFDALAHYIGQFGIGNFKKDTYLIWELAGLAPALGYAKETARLYKLVMRHHNSTIEFSKIRMVKDSLNHLENDSYVSLDYYYRIAEHSHKVDKLVAPHSRSINLGAKVNSPGPDYAPVFHAQSQSLLFTSQRNHFGFESEKINENLYITTRDSTGKWSRAKELDQVNSAYNEGSGCLSADGKTLYFSRCNSPDSYGNCDLFVSSLQKDGTWGETKNLGPVVNTSKWESHPTLSHSGDTLYFASDREGGFGQTDIYFTFKNALGKWVNPQNLGPAVNTKNHDLSPFYHPDHNVLYFSSNGQPNTLGLFDIYKSTKKNTHWSDPENVGPHVNHEGSEMYFTIDPVSNTMFFARSASHQLSKQDLYSFPLPMEAHPASTTSLRGTLTDSTSGEKLEGIVAVIDQESGIEVLPKHTDQSGGYAFDLIDKRNYLLVVRGKDFFRIEKEFRLDGPTRLDVHSQKISNTITFSSINFDFDSATVKPYMHTDLNKIVKFLFDNPDYKLRIEGHTDAEGSHEYNLDLSGRRAANIMHYILSAGIDMQRVHAEGYGKTRPLAQDASSDKRAINRRVEFHLSNSDTTTTDSSNSYKSITSL